MAGLGPAERSRRPLTPGLEAPRSTVSECKSEQLEARFPGQNGRVKWTITHSARKQIEVQKCTVQWCIVHYEGTALE
jgi:hypothetical protein